MAADAGVMVIDGAKGVEPQTRKLFKVCAMRHIPIFTFVNKMDRETRDPFDLLDEVERELGIETYAMNWPIGSGKDFMGVYDRQKSHLIFFSGVSGKNRAEKEEVDLYDSRVAELLDSEAKHQQLIDDVELLSAGREMDLEEVRHGRLSPVFFGSALTNFGVEPFLEHFLQMTPPPLSRVADCGEIDAFSPDFSAFVFKIQANMNKAHRDRLAFMRIVSGKFQRDMEYYHMQGKKKMRLSQPQQLMAADREIVEEAYAGDVIGVFDPGIFSIGDTITVANKKFLYSGIPTFAPEHFCRVSAKDSMKRKQFVKGTEQIAQEGAIQIFFEPGTGMERVIVGVVGVLQFDVLQFRMESEYGVKYYKRDTPHQLIRYIENDPAELNPASLRLMQNTKWVQDVKGRNLLVFVGDYEIDWALDKNPGLKLSEFHQNM
jgi:peptide chain release factor 3